MLLDFEPTMDARHVKNGYLTPNEMSWPVHTSDHISSSKVLYMLIHIWGYDHNSFRGRDGQLLNMFCGILCCLIERYFLSIKSKEGFARSMHVLHGMRDILGETNHAMIFHKLNNVLPKLFGFKKAAVLLMQAHQNQLFSIAYENEEVLKELVQTKRYSEDNVFSYPSNMGITG